MQEHFTDEHEEKPRVSDEYLEFLLREFKDRLNTQVERNNTLDNKLNFILITTSVLFSISALIPLNALADKKEYFPLYIALGIPFVSSFLLAIVFSAFAYRVRKLSYAPNPKVLVEKMDKWELLKAKRLTVEAMARTHENNEKHLIRKGNMIQHALIALYCQVVNILIIIGTMIILTITSTSF